MDSDPILAGLKEVTSKWTSQRKAEERSISYRSRRASMWTGPTRTSLKDICSEAMEEIWDKASDGGRLPTHWRQMFYLARPIVEGHPESDRPLLDTTFKAILEQYLEDFRPGWDILYGARGVLKEPHDPDDERVIPLSTSAVRNYLGHDDPDGTINSVGTCFPTYGPTNCYGAILICEKEGFDELLKADQVDARYDLALMSTKGISARAARDLVDQLGVPCFTLHDFDKNGFVMASGFEFATDIGLRLDDINRLGLAGEPQPHRNTLSTWRNLLKNGATRDEADYISGGMRVELNELPGRAFIDFVEEKLEQHRVQKVIPDAETLAAAWRRAKAAEKINALIEKANQDEYQPAPADLAVRVLERLNSHPELSWSEAVIEEMNDAEEVGKT